jgi:NADPH2:quinone reductase
MRAVLCRAYGPPESLSLENLPDPVPGAGEVLVEVAFAALNFFDTLIIENRYQLRPDLPFSPGAEFSGRIVATGSGVEGFAPGDRVAAYIGWGACRDQVVVRADQLIGLPDQLSDEAAAGLMVTYGTSLHALQDRARLQPGETLAVLGAAGGAGLAAVEIGKLLGARVIACASSAPKLALARAAGADDTLDYAQNDLREGLKQLTAGQGVDVLYDPVGGALAEPALRAMAWCGRYLVVGFAAGAIPKLPLNLVLLKGCDVLGVYWGAFTQKQARQHGRNTRQIFAWAAQRKLNAQACTVFPLARTGAAIRSLADRQAVGKVLVQP